MPTRLWFLWQPATDGIALHLICVATSLALFQWHGVMQVLQIHFARDVHFCYGIRIIYKLDKLPLFCIGTRFSGGIPLPLISLLFHTSANPFHPENSCKQIIIKQLKPVYSKRNTVMDCSSLSPLILTWDLTWHTCNFLEYSLPSKQAMIPLHKNTCTSMLARFWNVLTSDRIFSF